MGLTTTGAYTSFDPAVEIETKTHSRLMGLTTMGAYTSFDPAVEIETEADAFDRVETAVEAAILEERMK